MNKNLLSKISIRFFIITLIVILQAMGFVFTLKQSNADLNLKNKQINNLITEIGELKDENLQIQSRIEEMESSKTLRASALSEIAEKLNQQKEQEFKAVEQKNVEQFNQVQNELIKNNLALKNNLNKKEQELASTLKAKELSTGLDILNGQIQTILLLGENAKLTDSIILVTINQEKQKITMLSIPRDLNVEGRKINEYYADYGIDKTKEIIEKVSGLKVDNYMAISFDTFVDIVDTLGGINIEIEKGFTDTKYPDGNNGYMTVSFKEGMQEMDGEKALQYVRSRKSSSDFDRSRRQQQVLIAIKEKVRNLNPVENLDYIITIGETIGKNVYTDLNIFDLVSLYNKYSRYSISAGNVLSNENFLYSNKNYRGQYILLPLSGDFQEFQQKVLDMV